MPALENKDFEMPQWVDKKRKTEEEGSAAKKGHSSAASGGKGKASATSGSRAVPHEDHQLLLAVAGLTLDTATMTRELASASTIETMLLPCTAAISIAGLKEGKEYHIAVQERRGEDLGSPHIRIALKCLKALTSEALNPLFRTQLHTWWQAKVDDRDPSDLAGEIQIWKLQKPQQQTAGWRQKKGSKKEEAKEEEEAEYCKLTLALRDPALQEGLLTELTRLFSAVAKPGVAPRMGRERKVSELLANILKK
jgi:hypothetical protein